MEKTTGQYQAIIAQCRKLFLQKASDYGTSWTILRMSSVTDQIFIKAERIRSIQEKKENKVGESVEGEFIAIINYCVIALILLRNQPLSKADLDVKMSQSESLSAAYDAAIKEAFETMQAKNHDYGEAWRNMRISSITDLILMKIYRLKKIEDNEGALQVSEGADANYVDMLNYAVFSLIKMEEFANR